jgi:hypothetical protein
MCKAIASVIVCPFPSFHHWIRRETKEGPTVSMLFSKKKNYHGSVLAYCEINIYIITEDEHR